MLWDNYKVILVRLRQGNCPFNEIEKETMPSLGGKFGSRAGAIAGHTLLQLLLDMQYDNLLTIVLKDKSKLLSIDNIDYVTLQLEK